MKYRKKIWIYACIVMIAVSVFSGCGKKNVQGEETEAQEHVSAESLIQKASETLEQVSSLKGHLSMEMSMEYRAQGTDAALNMVVDQDITMVREPEAVYTKGTISLDLSDITLNTETYVVKESDGYLTYSNHMGQWTKQRSEGYASSVDAAETLNLLLENRNDIQFTGMETVGDDTYYQVEGRISGKELSAYLSEADGLLERKSEENDLLEAKICVKIEKDSGDLKEMSIDLTDSYHAQMQKIKDEQGFDSVTIKKFVVTMSGYTWNAADEIRVPETIKASAIDLDQIAEEIPEETESIEEDPEEPSRDDHEISRDDAGNYVLEADWDDSTATIRVPSGYLYDEGSDDTWLRFVSKKNDNTHELSLVYTLYKINENYGEEDLAQAQESSFAYMQKMGDYSDVSMISEQTIWAAGREISYTKLSYLYLGTIYYEEYNTWTVLDDGRMIQCTILETSFGEPCDRIDETEIFELAFDTILE